jgi:hypothetical protein
MSKYRQSPCIINALTRIISASDSPVECHDAGNRSYGDTAGLEIALGGDAELSTIIEAFKFIIKVLEKGREAAL